MSMLIYLLKVNIAITVLYGLYKLFFQKDTFFQWKRWCLLFIFFVSLIYPLSHFDSGWVQEKGIISDYSSNILIQNLPEILITPENFSGESNYFDILIYIYMMVSALLLIWMLVQIIHILVKVNKSSRVTLFGIKINILRKNEAPFSFLKWILIDPEKHTLNDLNEIIHHEYTHVRQLHSIDVIICEIMCIICWFNPFIWLMKREIRMNLEFLADHSVIKSGYDIEHYQLHLLRLSFPKAIATITNNFNVSLLKKRIRMMNKRKTPKFGLCKYLLFIPAIGILFFVNNVYGKITEINLIPEDKMEMVSDTLLVMAYGGNVSDPPISITVEDIFTHVEQMPEFPGGQNGLMRFLAENIKYPINAQKDGTQGTVVIRFVVNKDGGISDATVVRSIDPECDAEAIRVIRSMPNWEPGTQKGEAVSVYFSVPIRFKLAEDKKEN